MRWCDALSGPLCGPSEYTGRVQSPDVLGSAWGDIPIDITQRTTPPPRSPPSTIDPHGIWSGNLSLFTLPSALRDLLVGSLDCRMCRGASRHWVRPLPPPPGAQDLGDVLGDPLDGDGGVGCVGPLRPRPFLTTPSGGGEGAEPLAAKKKSCQLEKRLLASPPPIEPWNGGRRGAGRGGGGSGRGKMTAGWLRAPS